MREPWSECVVYSSSLTPEEKESKEFLEYCSALSPEELKEQAQTVGRLLRSAMLSENVLKRMPGVAECAPKIVSLMDDRFFEELIGMFEINCSALSFFGPVLTVLRNQTIPEESRLKAQTFIFEEILEEGEEIPDYVDQDTAVELAAMMPFFDGIAIFDKISIMQHSCLPNIINKFGRNHLAEVTARKDIAAGEELVHSYIDRVPGFEKRSRILRLWGFKGGCSCVACLDKMDISEGGDSDDSEEQFDGMIIDI
jgi:hypothetical protein